MPDRHTIVQIDDDAMYHERLCASCQNHLGVGAEDIIRRKSITGGLALFHELAQERQRIVAVVCNGEILNREDDRPSKETLNKSGGISVFARYQDLAVEGGEAGSVRRAIGAPPWIHYTNRFTSRALVEEWNQHSPEQDLHAAVWKMFDDPRILAVAIAASMAARSVVPPDDPRVTWAAREFAEDRKLGSDRRNLAIDFAPWFRTRMEEIGIPWPLA